ncbi:MAG: dihydrolipoamide acetyltransferase family protein [Caulobacteraceae bacterium]
MGRYVFKLPDVGEGSAEAEVTAWHVKVGDMVTEDQPLVDVMTEKATVELTAPVSGKILELNGDLGQMAPVGSAIVVLEVEGAGNASAEAAPVAKSEPAKTEPVAAPSTAVPAVPLPRSAGEEKKADASPALSSTVKRSGTGEGDQPKAGGGGATGPAFATRVAGERPLASPAVRKRAHELGIELQYVPGSGPAGRIAHEDLDAFIASGGKGAGPAGGGARYQRNEGAEEIRVIGLRRKISEKMAESKRRIPHFGYVEECDVTELEALRVHLNKTKRPDQPKLTLLPFIMRALVRVLPDYPQINATFDDEAGVVSRHHAIHVGMATQTPNGLIVPVIRHAEARDVWDIANEIARIAKATREGTASKDELSGSTITVTSLGPLGGVSHFPVINHPEVGIIGPNKIIEKPVVRDGQIAIRKMMNISSAFDHRVVDGWDAAEFISKVKALLEHPATVFMD